jgi:DNA polymerase III epsilon subunit-like protein
MNPISIRNAAITTARDILDDPDGYVVLDTETSGVGALAEILELAILSPIGETLFHQYFQPKQAISPHALAVHGLSVDLLEQKGAIAWETAHGSILDLLEGRTILAYNSRFDLAMLEGTAALNGLEFPEIEDICIMRLHQRFTGSPKPQALQGDHSALGDCLATIACLEQIARADLQHDPDILTLDKLDDLIKATALIEELSAQIKPLEAQLKALREQVTQYLAGRDLQEVPVGGGKKLKLYSGAKEVKLSVSMEDLPDRLKKTMLDRKAAQAETQDWTLESPYLTYSRSYGFRKVNL